MRIQTQEAPSMLVRVNFPVMAGPPSLDLPVARLAWRNAVIDPCDAASGLSRSADRGDRITVNPVDDLNTSLLSRAAECRRRAAHGLCIEAVNVHVHGVCGDRPDGLWRLAHRGVRAVRVGI